MAQRMKRRKKGVTRQPAQKGTPWTKDRMQSAKPMPMPMAKKPGMSRESRQAAADKAFLRPRDLERREGESEKDFRGRQEKRRTAKGELTSRMVKRAGGKEAVYGKQSRREKRGLRKARGKFSNLGVRKASIERKLAELTRSKAKGGSDVKTPKRERREARLTERLENVTEKRKGVNEKLKETREQRREAARTEFLKRLRSKGANLYRSPERLERLKKRRKEKQKA